MELIEPTSSVSSITYFKIIHLTNIVIVLNKANQYLNVVKHQFYFIQYYSILSST